MKRLKFFILISIFSVTMCWLGGFIIFDTYIKKSQNNTAKTDAIVVLTGGKNRIAEALRLFNEDMAELLIISGVNDIFLVLS